jgi:purine-binding chemotaxis protein CheW
MTNTATAAGERAGAPETGAQYLTFICAGEEYAVDILRVQEIKGWDNVTRVPYTASYILGVMNLRGVIVPVIDLRTRFGLEKRPFDASTVVIVVMVDDKRSGKTAGIVVDGVSEVYSFNADSLKPTPDLGGRAESLYVSGLATVDDKMVMLLDIESLVSSSISAEAVSH